MSTLTLIQLEDSKVVDKLIIKKYETLTLVFYLKVLFPKNNYSK
jgi:hypothetical protein